MLKSSYHSTLHPSLLWVTLPYPALPYLTLPYLTLPYLTLPYLTLPYLPLLRIIYPSPTLLVLSLPTCNDNGSNHGQYKYKRSYNNIYK